MSFWSDVKDFGDGLLDDLDGAIKDIGKQLTNKLFEGVNNLIDAISGIPSDLKDFLKKLPEELLDALIKMLHDPKFWSSLMRISSTL